MVWRGRKGRGALGRGGTDGEILVEEAGVRILLSGQTNHISTPKESWTRAGAPVLSCHGLGGQAAGPATGCGRGTSRCGPCSTHLIWRYLGWLSLWGQLPCLLYLRASPSNSWHWGELHQWFSKCVLQTACWEPQGCLRCGAGFYPLCELVKERRQGGNYAPWGPFLCLERVYAHR